MKGKCYICGEKCEGNAMVNYHLDCYLKAMGSANHMEISGTAEYKE